MSENTMKSLLMTATEIELRGPIGSHRFGNECVRINEEDTLMKAVLQHAAEDCHIVDNRDPELAELLYHGLKNSAADMVPTGPTM